MELKVGMYVRTSDGISKVVEVRNTDTLSRFVNEDMNIYFMNEITSSPSFNVIDLLEEGDYVNGYYVEDVLKTFVNVAVGSNYFQSPTIYEKDIKSIVTKEQFENMEYKI